jgi:hypothetical protein
MDGVIVDIITSNDVLALQNYILSLRRSDNYDETLILISRLCIDFDHDNLLKTTLDLFQEYNQQTHEVITKYCCCRGSFNCLKMLVKFFDFAITSTCFKTLVTFGRKIRYVKCLRFLLDEFDLPADNNLFKDCYDITMFECLLSLKLKGVNEINPIVLLRFANQLLDEEEKNRYPLTIKYLQSKSLI